MVQYHISKRLSSTEPIWVANEASTTSATSYIHVRKAYGADMHDINDVHTFDSERMNTAGRIVQEDYKTLNCNGAPREVEVRVAKGSY